MAKMISFTLATMVCFIGYTLLHTESCKVRGRSHSSMIKASSPQSKDKGVKKHPLIFHKVLAILRIQRKYIKPEDNKQPPLF